MLWETRPYSTLLNHIILLCVPLKIIPQQSTWATFYFFTWATLEPRPQLPYLQEYAPVRVAHEVLKPFGYPVQFSGQILVFEFLYLLSARGCKSV